MMTPHAPPADPIATELHELLEAIDRTYERERRILIAAFATITLAAALLLGSGIL